MSCARTIPSHVVFPVSMCCCLCSSRTDCFMISTFVLEGVATSRWWKPSQLLMSSVLKLLYELRFCFFYFPLVWHARCPTRGRTQRHGRECTLAQCRAEGLRGRLTRSLLGRFAISSAPLVENCEHVQMVKARSDWFESSWSRRHMLTRADF